MVRLNRRSASRGMARFFPGIDPLSGFGRGLPCGVRLACDQRRQQYLIARPQIANR